MTVTPDASQEDDAAQLRQKITEVGVGITLVGVIVNMGLTIGLGLSTSPLWLRLLLAALVPLTLVTALALASRKAGLLSTIPWWLTSKGPDPLQSLRSDDDSSPEG